MCPPFPKFRLSPFDRPLIFLAVKSRKNLLAAAALSAFAVSTDGASAQVDLQFSTFRAYRQIRNETTFLGGSLDLTVWDGNWLYGCTGPAFFPPSDIPPCPLGATGFLTTASAIIPDPYQEIFSVVPAALIEPSKPQDIQLYAAPPSKLPRPLGLFTDGSFFIWYNLQTAQIREYPITRYSFNRTYTSRSSMDSEVVPGLYQFLAPRLVPDRQTGIAPPPLGISVTHAPIPEGYLKQNNVFQGIRFTGLTWSPEGFAEFDPRLPGRISWEGNNPDRIYPGSDQLFFSVLAPADEEDPLSPIAEHPDPEFGGEYTLFPFFSVGSRQILLPTVLDKFYNLPPGFLPPPYDPAVTSRPFSFGRTVIARLSLRRNLASNNISRDTSGRDYELPIRFTNTFPGFVQQYFGGTGVVDADRAPGADPDGDGQTNFEEWLQSTNPRVANTPPADPLPPLRFPNYEDFRREYWFPIFPGFPDPPFYPAASNPDQDPDGDGLTNEEEWTLGTHPLRPNPVDPDIATLQFVPTSGVRSAGGTEGYWYLAFPKLAFHSSALSYQVEYSKDLINWSPVKSDDPIWTVVNDISADNIVVRSKSAALDEGGYFRLKTTYN
jgi:hypothetical protein